MITYCYLVFEYQPKYKYNGFITAGHYKPIPKVFLDINDAKAYRKTYKHCSFIKKVALR